MHSLPNLKSYSVFFVLMTLVKQMAVQVTYYVNM